MGPVLSVVIPVYNEEAVVQECARRLVQALEGCVESFELVFVDDGSQDRSFALLASMASGDGRIVALSLSRNFGHQAAVSAGLREARGQAVVVIDADLQDPPELIPRMLALWKEGNEVVYGQRIVRQGEGVFKKASARLFYRLLNSLSDRPIPVDTGDFRLMDRKVCDALNGMRESHRYLRGMVSWLGFRQAALPYERHPRFAGETKYPLAKMIRFATDGILSFSAKPLKIAIWLGSLLSLGGFAYLIWVFIQKVFFDATIEGWASLMGVLILGSGMNLLLLGVVGQYVGRIYDEVKQRPLYAIREIIRKDP
jgi:polyisoprenyl-phosphate glycosyltransferase